MTLHKFSKLFLFSLLAATLSNAQVCRVEQGCTGANTAVGARANLGLVIGTNVQAYSSALDNWAGKAVPSGTVVGTTDTQTLSSKTISAPIVTSPQINQIQDFNNNLSILLNPTANAVNGFVVTNAAAGGDVAIGAYGSSSNIGIQLVPKGTGKLDLGAVTALKISGAAGVVSIDGSGNVTTISPSGSGTVTSVGLSAPAIFSVSGSPVTTTGTLALSLATQTANTIWSGPTSGGAATPTFRSLVAADIPTLDAAKIGTGQLAAARVLSTVTNSRCVRVDGSGNLTVAAIDCTTNAGDTIAPATNTDAYVPIWNGANSKTLANGYCTTTTGTANCIPRLDAGGNFTAPLGIFPGAISVGAGGGGTMSTFQSSGTVQAAIQARRTLDFGSGHIMDFSNASGTTTLSYIAWDGSFSGNAATATALASSPSTCSAGQVIHGGITANGSPVGCNPINLASEVSGTLPVGNGGTGLSTYTSGGILYASASNTLASSGALTANAPVIGGGAGGAPTVGSRSGNTTTFATTSGVLTSGHCTQIDASGNIVDSGAACGGGGGSGTVTSVGLSLPTELTVSGSPVTTSGTLSATWANQSQRAFFAAPTGGSGTPSFRFLEAADIGSGTISVARGGTGASSFSGSKCVESNAGGTALQSSAGPCLSGSGSSTNGNIPTWSGSGGNQLSSVSYAATSTMPNPITASTVVLRDSAYGGSAIRDNGEQLYNVKAYGAKGDGSTDDTTTIQSALDACQNSTYGGTVFFPAGIYAISSTLTLYNGSGNTESTKKSCALMGVGGSGVDNVRYGTSVIRWTGSAPGVASYMLKLQGPQNPGGAINWLSFDANSKSNLSGILMDTISHLNSTGLSIFKHTGVGLRLTVSGATGVSGPGYGACDNTFYHLRITAPASGGSGLDLDGNYTNTNGNGTASDGGMDACSNTFYAPMLWHDANTASTYSVRLGFADNNRFFGGNFYGFPTNVNNGSGVLFVLPVAYSTGTVTTSGTNVTGTGTNWTNKMNGMQMLVNGNFYTFTYSSATTGTLSGSPGVTGASYQLGPLQFPHENTFMSISPHHGVTGTVGYATANVFYDYHFGDCFYNCDPSTSVTNYAPLVVLSTDKGLVGTRAVVTNAADTVAAFYTAKAGSTEMFKVARDGGNGINMTAYDTLSATIKNYSGTTQPYGCDSSHRSTLWLDTTSNPSVLKICGQNSGGSYVWGTITTSFP